MRENMHVMHSRSMLSSTMHARRISLQIGDQVVVLEKDSTHKTFAHRNWKQGKIVRVRSPYSYDVEMPDYYYYYYMYLITLHKSLGGRNESWERNALMVHVGSCMQTNCVNWSLVCSM